MKVSFVVAMSENRVIGKDGQLPWHLPNDLKRFRALTLGKHVLMGRRTFDSLKAPLSGRNNLVLSKKAQVSDPQVRVFRSKEEVLRSGIDELMVIGGEEIFRLFLPECQRIFLTLLHAQIVGDTYFPEFNGFHEVHRSFYAGDSRHSVNYSFLEYAT
ncbi:MAG TPA: dihydrofolate reductase [Myxococcota bacterium]|nr:dihydrofolate reductase [Myxococcota bacterium]